ncbi:hypothetical protein C8236_14530 [Paracidovorax avenae]|nr:hypothetical protein C8236_14530 [Paracidovorax avenae]
MPACVAAVAAEPAAAAALSTADVAFWNMLAPRALAWGTNAACAATLANALALKSDGVSVGCGAGGMAVMTGGETMSVM